MLFKDVLPALRQGKKVRRNGWGGFWQTNPAGDTIMIHTKEGELFDIRLTNDVWFTCENIAADDWEVLED